MGVLKNFAMFTGKHLCQILFSSCNFIEKETLARGFSHEFYKIFKNTFFTEHFWMTASILQQLLALYIVIICSWQLSSSEKSLVGKKKSSINLKDVTDLVFFFILFPFFSTLFDKYMLNLLVTQSVCCTVSSQPFCWVGDI